MAISYSQLRLYKLCPRQYEYASIKKLPRGINVYESFGSSVHNALKRWGELEVEATRIRNPESGIRNLGNGQLGMFEEKQEVDSRLSSVDCLLDLWHQSFIINTYENRVEADFHRKRGEEVMRKFYEWWSASSREVVAVEKSFKIDVSGVEVSGRIDRIERFGIRNPESGIRVVDFKTSPPKTQEQVDSDLQLSIYAMAVQELYGEPCSELILLFLNEEGVEEVVTQRNEGQLKDAAKQIQMLSEGIGSGEFRPTPSAGVCKRCPYKGVCDVAAV
ncbi:PD-(D/E)XK nuclease family protein [Patescibacteria group bacterium]|nr:PD-(D/E)XK nuclease family protein [Patescibacteria group bacterium]